MVDSTFFFIFPKEFGSLTTSQLMEKVKALKNLAYQLGLEEGICLIQFVLSPNFTTHCCYADMKIILIYVYYISHPSSLLNIGMFSGVFSLVLHQLFRVVRHFKLLHALYFFFVIKKDLFCRNRQVCLCLSFLNE